MPTFRRSIANSRLRALLAAWVLFAYLLSGALHGMCDLDVTNPSGKSEIASLVDHKAGHSEQNGLAEHHCHGCFSVAMAQPIQPVVILETCGAPNWTLSTAIVGMDPGTEAPPPKHLARTDSPGDHRP